VDGNDALALSIARDGIDVNGECYGFTHLHWATHYDRVAVVSCLLGLGADPNNNAPHHFMTPLGDAAYVGRQEVVELLVEVGNAQLDKRDLWGSTALQYAAAGNDRLETAKYFVARGCTIDIQDNRGETALDLATQHNHATLIQFLASASRLTTINDYSSLRSLCAPASSPFLSLNIARQIRYTTILSARHARHIIDDPSDTTPIVPFLHRLALLPSADNRAPKTESQVFRRILDFVGTGFEYVEEEFEQQLVPTQQVAQILALTETIATLTVTNTSQTEMITTLTETIAALSETIEKQAAALAARSDGGGGSSSKRARSEWSGTANKRN
jgi:hypothetical protein